MNFSTCLCTTLFWNITWHKSKSIANNCKNSGYIILNFSGKSKNVTTIGLFHLKKNKAKSCISFWNIVYINRNIFRTCFIKLDRKSYGACAHPLGHLVDKQFYFILDNKLLFLSTNFHSSAVIAKTIKTILNVWYP